MVLNIRLYIHLRKIIILLLPLNHYGILGLLCIAFALNRRLGSFVIIFEPLAFSLEVVPCRIDDVKKNVLSKLQC